MALSAADYNIRVIFLYVVFEDFEGIGVVSGASNETTRLVNVGALTYQSNLIVSREVSVDGLIEHSE
jgi:hypothetical protein